MWNASPITTQENDKEVSMITFHAGKIGTIIIIQYFE